MFSIGELCFYSKVHQDTGNEVKEISDKENSTLKNPSPRGQTFSLVDLITLSSNTQIHIKYAQASPNKFNGHFSCSV